jgi:hypothetical protein
MKTEKARLDADGTAQPKTRIVHHPPENGCVGPGTPLHNPEYEDESGVRAPLYPIPRPHVFFKGKPDRPGSSRNGTLTGEELRVAWAYDLGKREGYEEGRREAAEDTCEWLESEVYPGKRGVSLSRRIWDRERSFAETRGVQRPGKRESRGRTPETGRVPELARIVAFLQAEERKQDAAAADASLSDDSRNRCSARAGILRTMVARIERGDYRDAIVRVPVGVLQEMLRAYERAALEAYVAYFRADEPREERTQSERALLLHRQCEIIRREAAGFSAGHSEPVDFYNPGGMRVYHERLMVDYKARLDGERPLDAPPLEV